VTSPTSVATTTAGSTGTSRVEALARYNEIGLSTARPGPGPGGSGRGGRAAGAGRGRGLGPGRSQGTRLPARPGAGGPPP
jgi:hypothetical protein